MSQRKTFIDPERQSIINAGLSKLRMDPLEIADAIEQYNLNALPPTQCKILGPILPTNEECQKIVSFNGDAMNELQPVDIFCLTICGIIGYKERVRAMYFSAFYKELYSEFKEKIEKFFKAFDFIQKDKNFEKFLELIKSQNNAEFNVDLLVNDSTVEKICKGNEELIETLLKQLSEFSDLKPELIDSIKKYLNQFQDVKKLKETIVSNKDKLAEEDKSEEFLKGFYDDAEVKVKEIAKRNEDLDKEYDSVCKFLSTTSEKFKMKNFIETLGKFNAILKAAVKK